MSRLGLEQWASWSFGRVVRSTAHGKVKGTEAESEDNPLSSEDSAKEAGCDRGPSKGRAVPMLPTSHRETV